MRPETAAAVYDMSLASKRISEAVANESAESFRSNWLVQSAVERQFGILGEALVRIRELEEPVYDRFGEPEKIIGLRNILIHGYDAVDASVLWTIAKDRLPDLATFLEDLLVEAGGQGL